MKIKSSPRIIKRPDPVPGKSQANRPDIQTSQIKENQYKQAIRERQRLKAAEYSSKDPIRSHVKQRGDLVSRRIAHFQRKNPNQ